jgi:hypothetical protein
MNAQLTAKSRLTSDSLIPTSTFVQVRPKRVPLSQLMLQKPHHFDKRLRTTQARTVSA